MILFSRNPGRIREQFEIPLPRPRDINSVELAGHAGKITRAALTVSGLGPAPVRVSKVEQALIGNIASAALFREASETCRQLDAMGDVHAPASYRQHLAAVLSRRALEKAHARSGSADNE